MPLRKEETKTHFTVLIFVSVIKEPVLFSLVCLLCCDSFYSMDVKLKSFTVMSLNVRGLRDAGKRKDIFYFLKEVKLT